MPQGLQNLPFVPNLAPIIVITEDRASDRLLTASRVIAIELESIPIVALVHFLQYV